jgi:uncharacterized membrane protein
MPLWLRATMLGAAIGARSMIGPAALALTTPARADLGWLGSSWARRLTAGAAVGELLADKHPSLPSRLTPAVLTQRIVVSALCAAALGQRDGYLRAGPVLLAAAAGGGAVVTGVRWRTYTRRRGRALAGAAVEDLAAVALAAAACAGRR